MPSSAFELKDTCKGRIAVVMGGAPSLPEALKLCPENAIYISANQHGAMIRKVDYIFYTDRRHQITNAPMRLMLKRYGVPLVGPQPDADYVMETTIKGNSGIRAILFAALLGCDPIIVVGVEMYQGTAYWHDPNAKSTGYDKDPEMVKSIIDELVVVTSHLNVQQIGCNLPFPEYAAIPQWGST